MTIYNISDFSDFFKTLDSCGDDLTLITPDGYTYDWKTNRAFLLSFLQTCLLYTSTEPQTRLCFSSGNYGDHFFSSAAAAKRTNVRMKK